MVFRTFGILWMVSVFTNSVFALENYTELPTCGSAKAVSGDTCSTLKVEFSFEDCPEKTEPHAASNIICDSEISTARFQNENFLYEADFEKVEVWGALVWRQKGSNRQWKKIISPKSVAVKTAPVSVPTLAPKPTPISTSVPIRETKVEPGYIPKSKFRFGAFFDLRYSKIDSDLNTDSDNAIGGFSIEDGAIFATYTAQKLSLVADAAFRRKKDSEVPGTSTPENQSGLNDLAFATGPSQLFIKYRIFDQHSLFLGQFDKVVGIEKNDSKDRTFGQTGLIYQYLMPRTHMGAMLQYATQNDVTLKAFAANPNNRGTTGLGQGNTTTEGDNNTEYGTAITFARAHYKAQLAYMSRPITKAGSTSQRGERTLIDAILKLDFKKLNLDLQYANLDNDHNPGKPSEGFFFLAGYNLAARFAVGFRYEELSNFTFSDGTTSVTKAKSVGVALLSAITEELGARAEYVMQNIDSKNGQDWQPSSFDISAVITF